MEQRDEILAQARALATEMTAEEQAALCSGQNFWHTKPLPRLGVPDATLADGPHGLRLEAGRHDRPGLHDSVPATCYPTASLTACSFDPALLRRIGRALAEECIQEGAAMLLGPGVNIKRSPLCGRGFEYFSEDPLLAGECAAGMIEGLQENGVSACLKHFAANNQEAWRLVNDAVVDERALYEVYLRAFEVAVRKAHPDAVMSSYNLINGSYAGESRQLLTRVLRRQWGFDGLVVSDWGAVNQRVKALAAGMDLEMPGPDGHSDAAILRAVQRGLLDDELLREAAARVSAFALAHRHDRHEPYDAPAHHALAGEAAAESAVLLKNEGMLPLRPGQKVALLGGFAKTPHYQGGGSSQVHPTYLSSLLGSFISKGADFVYTEVFAPDELAPHKRRLAAALESVKAADVAVVCLGLPDSVESEGFDRADLRLPESQLALMEALKGCGKPVTVVLYCGGPVELPFAEEVDAILWMGLAGQNSGAATWHLLYGGRSPSGKLAETWPLRLEDAPFAHAAPAFGGRESQYRESVYVGYRWYDAAGLPVRYPFGHGLSYTHFGYASLTHSMNKRRLRPGEALRVRFVIKNEGGCAGKEAAQVYIQPPEGPAYRPVKQLAAFGKYYIEPGREALASLTIDPRAFMVYDPAAGGWKTLGGRYRILVGSSSRDIRLEAELEVEGEPVSRALDKREAAPGYYAVTPGADGAPKAWPRAEFEAVLGRAVSAGPEEAAAQPGEGSDAGAADAAAEKAAGKAAARQKLKFDRNTPAGELRRSWLGRRTLSVAAAVMRRHLHAPSPETARRMLEGNLHQMPLRALALMSGGRLSLTRVDGLVLLLNHQPGGLRQLVSGKARPKKISLHDAGHGEAG